MTPEELQYFVDSVTWVLLVEGSSNVVYVSADDLLFDEYPVGRWVFKKPVSNASSSVDAIKNRVDQWNKINPAYHALQTMTGWLEPFLGILVDSTRMTRHRLRRIQTAELFKTEDGDFLLVHPDVVQIEKKILDTYRESRILLADACVENNFLIHKESVVCISVMGSFRRGSPESYSFWQDSARVDKLKEQWAAASGGTMQNVVAMVKTLLYLEQQLAEDDVKNEYITADLIEKLKLFREKNAPITVKTMDILLSICKLDPLNEIKDKFVTPYVVERLGEAKIPLTRALLLDEIKNEVSIHELMKEISAEDLRLLIGRDNAILNQTNQYGLTPLHIAAAYHHINIGLLIDAGAELNKITFPASGKMYGRCNRSHDYPQMTAMDIALLNKNYDAAMMLFEKNAIFSSNTNYLLYGLALAEASAGKFRHTKTIVALIPDFIQKDESDVILLTVILNDDRDSLRYLINAKSVLTRPFNFTDPTCGYELAYQKKYNYQQYNGMTPLDVALHRRNPFIAIALYEAGSVASPAKPGSFQLIHLLAMWGMLPGVRLLIEQNPDLVHVIDSHTGKTAAMWAVSTGHHDVAEYLAANTWSRKANHAKTVLALRDVKNGASSSLIVDGAPTLFSPRSAREPRVVSGENYSPKSDIATA